MIWLQAQAWKIATGGAAIVAVVLGILLAASRSEVSGLRDRIDNPATGYVVQLSQCSGSLDLQSAKIDALNRESAARMSASERALVAALAASAQRAERADEILTYRPEGDTACARMDDIIQHYKEGLK